MTLKLTDLPQDVIEKIKALRYDQILEKHEGPWRWSSEFEYGNPEFLSLGGYDVLLPIEKEDHANITLLRTVISADGNMLTLFLKDMTHLADVPPEYHWVDAGRVAICEKISGQQFFVATFYHEWMIVENEGLAGSTG